jgi:hypothetical protein
MGRGVVFERVNRVAQWRFIHRWCEDCDALHVIVEIQIARCFFAVKAIDTCIALSAPQTFANPATSSASSRIEKIEESR